MEADEIRFIKGRLKFDDQEDNAPFPSAIIIFEGDTIKPCPTNQKKQIEVR